MTSLFQHRFARHTRRNRLVLPVRTVLIGLAIGPITSLSLPASPAIPAIQCAWLTSNEVTFCPTATLDRSQVVSGNQPSDQSE